MARRFAFAGAAGVAQEFAPEAGAAGRKVLWRFVAFASGSLAALGAHQLVKFGFAKATGRPESPDPTDPDTPLALAVGWAVAIAVGVVVGRRVGQRLAEKGWETHRGSGVCCKERRIRAGAWWPPALGG